MENQSILPSRSENVFKISNSVHFSLAALSVHSWSSSHFYTSNEGPDSFCCDWETNRALELSDSMPKQSNDYSFVMVMVISAGLNPARVTVDLSFKKGISYMVPNTTTLK